jgi:hypothetical protein
VFDPELCVAHWLFVQAAAPDFAPSPHALQPSTINLRPAARRLIFESAQLPAATDALLTTDPCSIRNSSIRNIVDGIELRVQQQRYNKDSAADTPVRCPDLLPIFTAQPPACLAVSAGSLLVFDPELCTAHWLFVQAAVSDLLPCSLMPCSQARSACGSLLGG